MQNDLAIIGKSTADLAELMGMSNVPARSTSALAEIKQVHQNVMGAKEVDGEMMTYCEKKAKNCQNPIEFYTEKTGES